MSCTNNTNSVALSILSGILSADLVVDPASAKAPNLLTVGASGVYVESDGWVPFSGALAYVSTDGHTYVVTTSVDARTWLSPGARIKLTQSGNTLYFVVTAVAAGTLTLYGGQNYSLTNAGITSPYFSTAKAPAGFLSDPAGGGWYEQLLDTSSRTQAAAVNGTWYNPGALSLAIPIGAWEVSFQAAITTSVANGYGALSTANNTASDVDLVAVGAALVSVTRRKPLLLAAKTSYFLNAKTDSGATPTIGFRGDLSETIIRATCAYL